MARFDRRSFLRTGGSTAAVGLAGCAGWTTRGEAPTVALAWVTPVENIGSLMAVPDIRRELPNVGDVYEFEGISVATTSDGVSRMAAGDADVALLTTVSYAYAIAQEAVTGNVTAIATEFWDAHPDFYGFTVYSAPGSDVDGPADLEGKRLGLNATGTGLHAVYVKQLAQIGIDPNSDVEFVAHEPADFTRAIRAGELDAGIYPALLAGQARSDGFTQVFRSQDVFETYPFAFYVAANRALEGKGDAIRAWGEDFVHLLEYCRNDRSAVVARAASHFELPEAALQAYFLTEDDYFRGDLHVDVDALNAVMDQMVALGFVERDRDYARYASNEYLP